MKKLLLVALGIVVGLAAMAQKEETRSLSTFKEVSSAEAIDVILKKGTKESATVRVNSSRLDIEDVLTEVSGGRLKIHLRGHSHRGVDVEVIVTYKSLRGVSASSASSISSDDPIKASGKFEVKVSSAADIELRQLEADQVEISASSSGDVDMRVNADEIDVSVSSAADVELSGDVKYQQANVSSAGDYDAEDLITEEADLKVSSGGSIEVHVTKKLNASASSGGSIRYNGRPQYVNKSSSSGGSINGD